MGVALTERGYRVSYDTVSDSPPEDWRSRILLGPADRLAERGWTAADDAGSGPWRVGRIGATAVLARTEPTGESAPPFLLTDAVDTADTAGNDPVSTGPNRRRAMRYHSRRSASTPPSSGSATHERGGLRSPSPSCPVDGTARVATAAALP
jgi:hypothetical protein